MRYPVELIGDNIVGGAPRDIEAFCDVHEARSLDAVYLRSCADYRLVRRVIARLKTGGLLAIRFSGGYDALRSRTWLNNHMNGIFNTNWWISTCWNGGDVIWTLICRYEGESTVHWEDPPLEHYVDLLRRNVPFSYLRYNDGEWGCVLEVLLAGPGCQTWTKELVRDVHASLINYRKDPHYYMSLCGISHLRDRVRQWELIASYLRENKLDDVRWVSAGTFNGASETGKLWPFIQHLQESNIIIVGPPRYGALSGLFPEATFVTIPATQCHSHLEEMQDAILAQDLPATILITAGPACKPLIYNLWPIIGSHSTMIDMGSIWAPYTNTAEHLVHIRMLKEPRIMEANVGGREKWAELKRALEACQS